MISTKERLDLPPNSCWECRKICNTHESDIRSVRLSFLIGNGSSYPAFTAIIFCSSCWVDIAGEEYLLEGWIR